MIAQKNLPKIILKAFKINMAKDLHLHKATCTNISIKLVSEHAGVGAGK